MKEMKLQPIHSINTFQVANNEIYIGGLDEKGEDITIIMNAYEVLEWLDIKYIKQQTIKHIKSL